jgi:hypothetical protein
MREVKYSIKKVCNGGFLGFRRSPLYLNYGYISKKKFVTILCELIKVD